MRRFVAALCLAGAAPLVVSAQLLPPPPPPPADPPTLDDYEEVYDEYGNYGLRLRDAEPDPLPSPLVEEEPVDPLVAPPVPQARLDVFRADPDFQYDRPRAEQPTLWDRFWAWLKETLWDPVYENTPPDFFTWAYRLAAIALLAWVVTRLLRAEGTGVFSRRDVDADLAGPLFAVEDIEAVDLRARLQHALGEGLYRDAVRFRYLLALQTLAAQGALAWRIDKTNRDYLREVRASRGPSVARPLAAATRVFDHVWYGEREVDSDLYARLGDVFEKLDRVLTPVAA